ncbi:MAG: OmpA family protein, partial [Polyangiaceae bacterium]|nr:OmpA family protein [Polyangiaceae bacterium]
MSEEEQRKWRRASLKLNNNFFGSTGLLRLSDAGSAAVGTFRFSLMSEWFTTTGFLCTDDRPCGTDPATGKGHIDDEASHFGATFGLSVTPLAYLEAFASFRSYANSNNRGRPELLQVLGDSILGVKSFMPAEPDRILRFGGEAQLLLVNGTGGVGLDASGTGMRLRGLATVDLAARREAPAPLRVHANLGYRLDNTAEVVADSEESRGDMPITRIERFGLGINRTDFIELGVGIEGVFNMIHPFIEYSMDVPLANRQDYVCNTSKATTVAFRDACLGQNHNLSYVPSRLSLGARGYPVLAGLAPFAAMDIGITGTTDFLAEVSPQSPWTLYVGIGYAVDTAESEPVTKTETVERIVSIPLPARHAVRGTVVEQGTTIPIANAIVFEQGAGGSGYVTGAGGVFETRSAAPGIYTFVINADGYKDGQCIAQVPAAAAAPPMGAGAEPVTDPTGTRGPVAQPYGAQSHSAAPGTATGTQPPVIYSDVNCSLEAMPKVGNVVGRVTDAKTNSGVANVSLLVTDSEGKQRNVSTDNSGNFRIDGLKPGEIGVKVEAADYLMRVETARVESRKDSRLEVGLTPRPRQPKVMVTKTQIIIREQVHFETDSAVIKGDSNTLLEEVADVLNRNPEIRKVEVQGHTDNTGTGAHNQTLSEQRAAAVKDWLVAHGVDASRLESKGYGQTRPVAP